jgi:Fe-S-cluster containining protein
MQFVPWRNVADWKCIGCGDCCRLYSVVINFNEWLRIVKNYGVEQTVSGLNKLYIKRRADGSCAFLCNFPSSYRCGVQHMKPRACQLWPFKVFNMPQYGYASEAEYPFGDGRLFVYVDSMCNGLRYGKPTLEFAHHTVKEFVEVALGFRDIQFRTTANIGNVAGAGVQFYEMRRNR